MTAQTLSTAVPHQPERLIFPSVLLSYKSLDKEILNKRHTHPIDEVFSAAAPSAFPQSGEKKTRKRLANTEWFFCSSGQREDVGSRPKFPGEDCNTSEPACGRQKHGVFPVPMWEGHPGQTPEPSQQEASPPCPPCAPLPHFSPREVLPSPRSQARAPQSPSHVSVPPLHPHPSLPWVPSLFSSLDRGIRHCGSV